MVLRALIEAKAVPYDMGMYNTLLRLKQCSYHVIIVNIGLTLLHRHVTAVTVTIAHDLDSSSSLPKLGKDILE